uniref:Uncharacterized protein n=1 Tax=Knipowitschia caucasica TaxID=637954 RepID=A0AAV2IYJ7_KNICA
MTCELFSLAVKVRCISNCPSQRTLCGKHCHRGCRKGVGGVTVVGVVPPHLQRQGLPVRGLLGSIWKNSAKNDPWLVLQRESVTSPHVDLTE